MRDKTIRSYERMPRVRFEVKQGRTPHSTAPVAYLARDKWDDFGFRTTYGVTIVLPDGQTSDLGRVKIMRQGQEPIGVRPEIGPVFHALGDEFCSLGQNIEYYEKLANLPAEIRYAFLAGIRDVVADESIREEFESEPAWSISLLRFAPAVNALEEGAELLHWDDAFQDRRGGGTRLRRRRQGRADFTFERVGDDGSLRFPFSFDDSGHLPGRCNVIIGYNGAGKTHLLAQLARVASRGRDYSIDFDDDWETDLTGTDTTFGAVIAISYSAFDTFKLPSRPDEEQTDLEHFAKDTSATTFFGYTYCGLRRTDDDQDEDRAIELKSPNKIDDEFLEALESASLRWMSDDNLEMMGDVEDALSDALDALEQEPSFGRIGISPSLWGQDIELARSEIRTLSTGHKIVANIVVQLAAHLRSRSLVLIDEPETHLHPPLLAALLRAIQRLLDAYDSFAVIATHSPVVLQETPAKHVRVLTRIGDVADVASPRIETFGESISEITRDVFSLDSSATDYQGVIRSLAAEYSREEVEGMFSFGLSSQARALFLRAKKERR